MRGINGLIVLGAAWQSVDAYKALADALTLSGQNQFAGMAVMRAHELIDAGGRSKHPGAPGDPKELRALIGTEPAGIDRLFVAARAATNRWHDRRTAFMMSKLEAGKHPDTDKDFWEGYSEGSVSQTKPAER